VVDLHNTGPGGLQAKATPRQPTSSVAEEKAALRLLLKRRRATWSPLHRSPASKALSRWVVGDPRFLAAAEVALFVGARDEIDTRDLLEHASTLGKLVWLPRILPNPPTGEPTLEWRRYEGPGALEAGRFGLAQPSGEAPIGDLERCDLVFVPGLAFSRSGHRLGMGVGYYDRALAPWLARAKPLRIGVVAAEFVDPAEGPIPCTSHDVRMQVLATDEGIVECRDELASDDPAGSTSPG